MLPGLNTLTKLSERDLWRLVQVVENTTCKISVGLLADRKDCGVVVSANITCSKLNYEWNKKENNKERHIKARVMFTKPLALLRCQAHVPFWNFFETCYWGTANFLQKSFVITRWGTKLNVKMEFNPIETLSPTDIIFMISFLSCCHHLPGFNNDTKNLHAKCTPHGVNDLISI